MNPIHQRNRACGSCALRLAFRAECLASVAKFAELAQSPAMKMCAIVMFVGALLWAGCNNPEVGVSSVPPSTNAAKAVGQPQPKLPTIKLWLGAQEMIAEQAVTRSHIETGMMFRTEMAENEGMLFVFSEPYKVSFWMRNTLLPLSCAYIGSDGVILEIHDMKPLDETPIEAGTDRVQFVLETKQGWFQRNNVGVGALVKTERGPLTETYFGKTP